MHVYIYIYIYICIYIRILFFEAHQNFNCPRGADSLGESTCVQTHWVKVCVCRLTGCLTSSRRSASTTGCRARAIGLFPAIGMLVCVYMHALCMYVCLAIGLSPQRLRSNVFLEMWCTCVCVCMFVGVNVCANV
jgi:hypothetical protein